jgi:hypothetical protein
MSSLVVIWFFLGLNSVFDFTTKHADRNRQTRRKNFGKMQKGPESPPGPARSLPVVQFDQVV